MKKMLSLFLVWIMITACVFCVSAEETVQISASFVASVTNTEEIYEIPQSNSLAVKLNMVNNGAEETLKLCWVGYNDNKKLVSAELIDVEMPANATNKKEILPLTTNNGVNIYKLFVWSSELVPYTNGLCITKTGWSDWYDYDFYTVAGAGTTPVITATGASIKVPDSDGKTGIRFKMTVNTPASRDIEIVEQGAAVIPFYMIGEKDFTLETANVSKIINDGSKYSAVGNNRYEFVTALGDVPVHKYSAPICVKGYVTYLVYDEPKTVYSDIAIYDTYSIAEEIIKSKDASDETKNAVSTYIKDAYDAYINNVVTGDRNKLSFSTPAENEVVYPYKDYAKKYLLAGENRKEGEYESVIYHGPLGEFDVAKAIDVTWNCKYENVDTFTVAYATKQDFSDAKFAYADGQANKVSLYNLYKASDYYVKVIANLKNGTSYAVASTFKTADLGPRQIHLDGSCNARDMGGYMTSSGERTVQGMLYRSGQMDKTYLDKSTALTAYGKYTAQRELGIVTDVDFRGSGISPIPGAKHIFVGLSGYDLVSATNQSKIRDTFKIFSDINNYPIVFHCTGGADRTGTIAYLLNALLGVSEKDIIRDYEWTSYSIYSTRSITSTDYIAKESYGFFTTLSAQSGKTLQERCENYLLSIGVTAEEIDNIKSIMFTGRVPGMISVSKEVSKAFGKPLTITVGAMPETVSDVYVGGAKVNYTLDGNVLMVDFKDIPTSVKAGEVAVKVVFKDCTEFSDTIVYDPAELCLMKDYMDETVLDSANKIVTSSNIGYGKWVRMRLDATNDTNGNFAVFVGSYGAKFRGGETRYHTLDASGKIGLDARPKHYDIRQSTFQNGNKVYLYIKVDLVNSATFKVSLKAVHRETGEILCEHIYTGSRIANEMAEQPVTFVIDGTGTSKLVVYGE